MHEVGSGAEGAEGLRRERLVGAALDLIGEEGLEGLSMRALADRLQVKAASLYWHVRDRRELLELLADSILDTVRPARGRSPWRPAVLDAAAALPDRVAAQKDANRILLEVPESLAGSTTYAEIKKKVQAGGFAPARGPEGARLAVV